MHVARATIFTGCLKGKDIESKFIEKKFNWQKEKNKKQIVEKIDEVWKKASEKSKESEKYQLDEPLWRLSREGCSQVKNKSCKKYNECPVKHFCVKVK